MSPNEPPLIFFTVSYDEALTFASDYGRAAPAGVYEVEPRGTVFYDVCELQRTGLNFCAFGAVVIRPV